MPLSRFLGWGLYIGGRKDAENFDNLTKHRINYIVSSSTKKIEFPPKFQVLRYEVRDRIGQTILHKFREVAEFIDEAKQGSQSVLIHCDVGQSRSCALAIAYTMHSEKRKLWLTLVSFRQIRRQDGRDVRINSSFMLELYELEKQIFGVSSVPNSEIKQIRRRLEKKLGL